MQVKPAGPDDAEYIALLGRVTFTETFGHLFKDRNDLLLYLEATFNVPKIRDGLTKNNNVFWLAYVNELPVGYAKLKIQSPTPFLQETNVSQLQKIYILKDFLGKKIGLQLQNVLLHHTKKLKADKIWLSVLKTNTRAIGFYRKHGFYGIGEHQFQIGKEVFDFQAMAKDL